MLSPGYNAGSRAHARLQRRNWLARWAAVTPNGTVTQLEVETTSPVLEALTVGAWIGWVLNIAGKLLFSLGLGWLWLRIKERAEHERKA